ncbi:unnamed protein product, partial [Iphiclides podalirius]
MIEYFGLAHLVGGPRQNADNTEIKLNTNKTMNMAVSLLMSILGTLICLTLPFAVLEKPLGSFASERPQVRNALEWIERHLAFIDRIIVATAILLVLVAADTIVDAIRHTNIKVSPWVQRGKYLPRKYKAQSINSITRRS